MRISVIGAGSWGTALSQACCNAGNEVSLWARDPKVCAAINEDHKNPRYLVDAPLSERIHATPEVGEALQGADAVLVVTPSPYMRSTAASLAPFLSSDTPVAICTKGIEEGSGKLPFEVFADILGNGDRIAALTGPNHAEEVVYSIPSATVVASHDEDTAAFLQGMLNTDDFRVYVSRDIVGAELCSAFKNVIAICVGISYGLGLGDNTAAALMTRGIAEMSRLVEAAGGDPLTCMGLAGAGDLIVTCTSKHSRNRSFGYELAGGTSLDEYRERTHMVVEGAYACKTLGTLSARYDVELPITEAVRAIVWEGMPVADAQKLLQGRNPRPEFY